MSKRLVTILWAIAGLLAALTLIVKSSQGRDTDAPTERAQGDVLLKELPLKQVTAIKVEDAEKSVTIRKDESEGKVQWSVAERAGYEADFAKLTRLIRSVTEVTVAQSKKAGPAFNERFGMDGEADNQENHGYSLSFLGADGKEIQTLAIGKSTAGEGASSAGKYVRLGDEPDAVYAVNESFFELSADPTDWLSSDFIAINGIKSITLEPAAEDTINGWSVSREDAGADFTIDDLAASREPQSDKLSPLKNVLSAPRFDDVLTTEEAQAKRDESKARKLTIQTFEGFTYLIDYAPSKPEETDSEIGTPATTGFIVKIEVDAKFPEKREKTEGESEEEAKKAEADFVERQKALTKKLANQKAFSNRYYQVADYTLSALNIGLDALAKPVVKTEPIAPSAPAGQQLGPLAPPAPVQESSTTARPPRASAVSPPVAVPPVPQKAETEATEETAEDTEPSNGDALNVLSEEDIKRIVEETKAAEESE